MFQQLRAFQAILLIAFVSTIFSAPLRAQSTDQPIYTDSLQNGWQSYGWATLNYGATGVVHGGSNSISIAAGPYQAMYLHHAAFDSSTYTTLSFWINGGPSGGQHLQVQAELNGVSQTAVALGTLTANTWQQITIPLASLGVANKSNLDGFWIQDTSGNTSPTYYVDDMTLVGVPAPNSINLTVDPSAPVRTIDSRIFGLNTVIWGSGLGNASTSALLAANGTASLRYPGGSASDAYDWTTNMSEGGNFQWAASFATFAKLAEYLGAKTYITVNYGNGTPQMAAAWVAYANGSPSNTAGIGIDSKGRDWKTVGYWATLRASSPIATDDGYNFLRVNHPTPYGFQYWEIGNENYGSWENDQHGVGGSGLTGAAHDGYTYANYMVLFMQAMRAVDPTIKIGAVTIDGEDAWGNGTHAVANPNESNSLHSGWTPVVLATLKTLNAQPDFVIYHRYPQEPGSETDAGLLQASAGWAPAAANFRKMITDYVGATGTSIELAVTESNSVTYGPGKQTTSLVNGLFCADSLAALAQTEFNACEWWDIYNASETGNNNSGSLYGWRQFGDYGILATGDRGDTPFNTPYPAYYAGKLLTHWGRGGDQVVSATTNYNLLSCYAVKQQNGTVALLVINKSPNSDITGHIALANYVPGSSTATVYQYGKSEDLANGDLTQTTLSNASAAFDVVFPAYSMSVINLAPAITTPAAPSNLTASATSTSQINLAWNTVSNATGYTIYRSTTQGGPYTQIGTASTGAYSDLGLSSGTAYYYVVTASNGSGPSGNSSEATATTLVTIPGSLSNLTATGASASQVNLTWTAASGATSYNIFRSASAGTYHAYIGTSATNSFSNTGLTAATTYYYVVVPVNSAGSGPKSAEVPGTTLLGVPAAPTNVVATGISGTQINVTWNTVPGATSYNIFRGTTQGGYHGYIGNSLTNSFNNTGLTSATTYYYIVIGVNAAGQGAKSAEVAGTTLLGVPAAPTNVVATPISASQINLTWNAVPSATSYYIFRGTTLGGYHAYVGSSSTNSFNNTGLSAATTYYYIVIGVNSAGQGAKSAEIPATTLTP